MLIHPDILYHIAKDKQMELIKTAEYSRLSKSKIMGMSHTRTFITRPICWLSWIVTTLSHKSGMSRIPAPTCQLSTCADICD